jgi:hypothetical protein
MQLAVERGGEHVANYAVTHAADRERGGCYPAWG